MKSTKWYLFAFLLTVLGMYARAEKRMAVIIPSYCNAQWYKKNLDSLFNQEYSNWYAIYIDDFSEDGTADLVKDYVKECGMESKVTILANQEHKGALANHYIATHMCDDWDIVVQLDGDDWFPKMDVLSYLNEIYDDQDIWLTYGSFVDWPTGKQGYSKPTPKKVVDERLYRETHWTPGQLRTFYAWVFKKIKLEDFLWNHKDESFGEFYPASCDLAFSYPMMEMVGNHFKYINDIIYIHNVATPLNDFKVNRIPQVIASNVLLHKTKYDPIIVPPARKNRQFKKTDVIILSHDGLDECQKTIDSCLQHLKGIHKIMVVDVVNNTLGEYKNGQVVPDSVSYKDTRALLVKELHNWWYSSEHVFFIHNGMQIAGALNLKQMAHDIESAQAVGFFPSLGVVEQEHLPCVHLNNGLHVWRVSYAHPDWLYGDEKFCFFAKKEGIRHRIAYLDSDGDLLHTHLFPNLFAEGMLFIQDSTITTVGLSYKEPKVVPLG